MEPTRNCKQGTRILKSALCPLCGKWTAGRPDREGKGYWKTIDYLKVKPKGFAVRLDVRCEREKGLKDDANISAFTEMGSNRFEQKDLLVCKYFQDKKHVPLTFVPGA